MDTDRTIRPRGGSGHMTETDVAVLRQLYAECTTNGAAPAHLPDENSTPCTIGELKEYLGASRIVPISATSVHRLVTGQTHANAPGPTFPMPRDTAATAGDPGEGTHVVAVREVYRVGKAPAGERGRRRTSKRDTATLVSRTVVRGTGEKGHLVEVVRLVTVDADGVVVSPGTPLKVEGSTDEGNRELSKGKVLDAMCDPKLVLDGRPNGLPAGAPGAEDAEQ